MTAPPTMASPFDRHDGPLHAAWLIALGESTGHDVQCRACAETMRAPVQWRRCPEGERLYGAEQRAYLAYRCDWLGEGL